MRIPTIVLYTKPSCCLCKTAKFLIERTLLSIDAFAVKPQIHEIDISKSNHLEEEYGHVLPVIEIDGEVVSELKIDMPAIRKALLNM